MKLTLYYAPYTCALVPYVTLTEAGAQFDVQNVNTRSGQNRSAEFMRVNPKAKTWRAEHRRWLYRFGAL